jgi:hypothetical protein
MLKRSAETTAANNPDRHLFAAKEQKVRVSTLTFVALGPFPYTE